MKAILVFLLSAMFTVKARCQDTVAGYYVTLNNDTVVAQIKLPKAKLFNVVALAKFIEEVEILDSTNHFKVFYPGEIKSYALTHQAIRYRFYSKPIKNGNYKFLQPVVLGTKASMYQYATSSSGGYGISNTRVFYTFENSAGAFDFVSNTATLNKFQEVLTALYQAEPGIAALIESKFQKRINIQGDIMEILNAINAIKK